MTTVDDDDAIEVTFRAYVKICDRPCPYCGAMCARDGSEGPWHMVLLGERIGGRCAYCPPLGAAAP